MHYLNRNPHHKGVFLPFLFNTQKVLGLVAFSHIRSDFEIILTGFDVLLKELFMVNLFIKYVVLLANFAYFQLNFVFFCEILRVFLSYHIFLV